MDLRAFKKNITIYSAYIYAFLFTLLVPGASALGTSNEFAKIPSEVKFADVVFQFNDATKNILEQEISILESNEEIKRQNLSFLSTYLPEVEPLLQDAAVPSDFKYLVIYNKFQQSISRSTLLDLGVFWCMDEAKAQDVNLTNNKYIDERKHLYAASEGAIICLRRNQVLYNNWGSTLFAHLADRNVLDLLEIRRKWNENKYILLDSPAYASVIQFLAYKIVMERNLQSFKPTEQLIVYKYPYGANKAFNVIAADLRVEPTELLKTNEWLKVNYVPNIALPLVVVVPAMRYHDIRQLAEISRNVKSIEIDLGFPVLTEEPKYSKGNGGVFYKINDKNGVQADLCDNFVTLAYKAKLKPKKFLKYNELDKKDVTKVGRIYYLESKNNKGPIEFHVVRYGESIWDISQLYAVKIDKLLKYNRLKTIQRLQEGRVVHLRQKRGKKEPIRYMEEVEQTQPTDFMLTDPIFSDRSVFQQDIVQNQLPVKPEPEVVEEKFVPKVIPSTEAVDVIDSLLVKRKKDSLDFLVEEPKTVIEEAEEEVYYVNESSLIRAQVPIIEEVDEKSLTVRMKESVTGKSEEPKYVVHKVKKGETLYRISVNYKVSVDQLYKLNDLTNNIIEIGDEIKVKKR